MIEIPPGTDSMDLDGDDTAEEPRAYSVEATDVAKPERPFMFSDAEQWLHRYALPRYLRKLGSNRSWAPNWYDYPEAYSLITALWESWEQMRWEGPQQILVFYRDYFYPLMDRLTAMDGPFHAYDKTTHPQLPETFPVWDAPPGYFRQGKDAE
ncbi:DUF4913 domain-containing protein [Paeniglutamicibacter sp. NPDC012692]|uniref:DUF4913 domain-containing protein n=1 Tax=Paeniglutamicibacter sp. NPDC012692 TaxID=3364388 RepID=UPI00369947BB